MRLDPVLVLASVLIAYTSAYTALDLQAAYRRVGVRQWLLLLPAAIILALGYVAARIGLLLASSNTLASPQWPSLLATAALSLVMSYASLAAIQSRRWTSVAYFSALVGTSSVLLHFARSLGNGLPSDVSLVSAMSWSIASAVAGFVGLYAANSALRLRMLSRSLRVAIAAIALGAVVVAAVLSEKELFREATHGLLVAPMVARGMAFVLLALMVGAALADHLRSQHAERQFHALSRHALDLVLVLAQDGTVLQASPSIQDTLGFVPSDLQGRRITALMSREEAAAFLERIRGETGQPSLPFHYEGRLRHRDGSWRDVEGIGTDLTRDPDVGGVVLNLLDVTERRADREELERVSRQREIILAFAGEGIVGVGPDARITFANAAALAMVGLSEVEVVGQEVTEVFRIASGDGTEYSREESPVLHVLRMGGVVRAENRYLGSAQGVPIPVDYIVAAREMGGRIVGALALYVDVSQRRRFESEKQQVADRFLSMLEQVGDVVATEDLDGRLIYVNRAGRERLGLQVGDAWDAKGSRYGRLPMYNGEGEPIDPQEQVVLRVIQTGRAERNIERIVDLPTGERRHFLMDAAPVQDASGIAGAIFTLHDVTERRRAEEEILRARRIESVGLLAGGIAHDFNNFLAVLVGTLSLARAEIPRESDASALLAQAEAACQQATKLTRQLLTFSKGGAPVIQPLALPDLVRETVRFALTGASVHPRFELAAELWSVEADEAQISQVLQNLVINAKQAMPGGGTIEVEARNVPVRPDGALPLEAGDYVRISIRDEGTGIAAEHIDRIFDPYFTTKPTGQGLGLATTWSIVRRHGGHISVESIPGGGTAFHVYLRRTHRAALQEVAAAVEETPPLHILVMDDEPDVRDIAGRMLQSLGHRVDCVEDGDAAIERSAHALREGDRYEVALLDLTVSGGMGGEECAKHLRGTDPALVLVATSGYSNDAALADPAAHGFDGVLGKPYRLQDIKVAMEMAARGAGEHVSDTA